ncbi:penton [Enterobacteria phage PRDpeacock]
MNVNNPNQMTVTPVYNGCDSGEGPQSVRGYFEALPGETVRFDLTYLKDTQGFSGVQCVYIDNSENDGAAIIDVEETGQRITCPAGKQGYFPLLVPGRAKFVMRHNGSGKKSVPVFFLNFTIAQGVW